MKSTQKPSTKIPNRKILSVHHISVWRLTSNETVVGNSIDSFEVERAFQVSIKVSATFALFRRLNPIIRQSIIDVKDFK